MTKVAMTIDEFIANHPSRARMLRDAIAYLDENEPKWDLSRPIDRVKYLKGLVKRSELLSV